MGDHTLSDHAAPAEATELLTVPVAALQPHPDNPRLQLRTEVVDQLAAEMARTGFGPEHALLVRPYGDGFQIVSGHHRWEAAKQAGIETVPCWVKSMHDDEAFMQLVLENTQGELSPLEIGLHALRAVPPAERKAGQGFKAYAERIGISGARVGQLHAAAEVVAKVDFSNPTGLLDKATHLYEISRADERLWPQLIELMLGREWSVTDTKHFVSSVREFDIPREHRDWLPLADVARAHLEGREFSPRTVGRLVASVRQTLEWIAANRPEAESAFRRWLIDGRGAESWQPRAVAAYLQRLIAEQFVATGWHQGDWRDHIDNIDDGSVSLVLTDPPYGQGYQSDYRLDRRIERKHNPIAADDIDAPVELLEALEALGPKLTEDAHVLVFCGWAGEPEFREVLAKAGLTLRGSLVWDKQATGMGDPDTTFAPAHERILHAVKGSPVLFSRAADLLSHRRCDSSRHPTEKPVDLIAELIEATTAEGQLVADPFGGVASTAAAAKSSGRRWWSCELNETYYAVGEERLL